MISTDQSTLRNYQLYNMTVAGASPVLLAEMKSYLGIGSSTSNDVFIQTLIDSCTQYGQKYTAREFTANTYELFLDQFDDRISLHRNPVNTITSIEYLVSNVLTTVDSSTYYKKNGLNLSEILLIDGKEWPEDIDTIEQGIKIIFVTKAVGVDKISIAKNAILRHVAFMFSNRGDCDDCGSCAGKDGSNTNVLYDTIRLARV